MFGEDVFNEYEEIVKVYTTNIRIRKKRVVPSLEERFLIFCHSIFYYKRTHRL